MMSLRLTLAMNFTTQTFMPILQVLIEEAHQSNNLESLWYHPWSEVLNLCAKANSSHDAVLTVAPQRAYRDVSRHNVTVTRESRVGTRSVTRPEDLVSLREEDEQMDDANFMIEAAANSSMESRETRQDTFVPERDTHKTPDFSIYLHQLYPTKRALFPVALVEIKPLIHEPTTADILVKKDSDLQAFFAASTEAMKARRQMLDQMHYMFVEYPQLSRVLFVMIAGDWFHCFPMDRNAVQNGDLPDPKMQYMLNASLTDCNQEFLKAFQTLRNGFSAI